MVSLLRNRKILGLVLALSIFSICVATPIIQHASERSNLQEFPASTTKSSAPYPHPLDGGNITIYFDNNSATNFTWIGAVEYNFIIISLINANITLRFSSPGFQDNITMLDVTPGVENKTIKCIPSLFALPGDNVLNFLFEYNSTSADITHTVWVGSGLTMALVIISAILFATIIIIAKIRETSLSSAPSSAPISSTPSGAPGDDSAVTYVDQSRAPAGKIFCPECKKLIEEGSIFCPECGTRIPRYLRYRPQQ